MMVPPAPVRVPKQWLIAPRFKSSLFIYHFYSIYIPFNMPRSVYVNQRVLLPRFSSIKIIKPSIPIVSRNIFLI